MADGRNFVFIKSLKRSLKALNVSSCVCIRVNIIKDFQNIPLTVYFIILFLKAIYFLIIIKYIFSY